MRSARARQSVPRVSGRTRNAALPWHVLSRGLPQNAPCRDALQAADRRTIAWSARQLGNDRLAPQFAGRDRFRREALEHRLLLGRRRGVDPGVTRLAELSRQFLVVLAWILAGAGGDL